MVCLFLQIADESIVYGADRLSNSNDCKRRKVKCNGQVPCERCHKLTINCEYAPNYSIRDPYLRTMQEHIESLQQQVNDLYSRFHLAGLNVAGQSYPMQQQIAGPNQSFDPSIQNQTIPFTRQSMTNSGGYQYGQTPGNSPYPSASAPRTGEPSPMPNTPYSPLQTLANAQSGNAHRMHENKDPVWSMELGDVVAVVQNLNNVDRALAACLDLPQILATAQSLFSFVDSVRRTGLMKGEKAGPDAMNGLSVDLLKMTFAVSLYCSDPNRIPEAQLLAQNVKSKLGDYVFETGDGRTVALFLLVAIMSIRDSGDGAAAQRALNIAVNTMKETGLDLDDVPNWTVPSASKPQLLALVQYIERFQREQLEQLDGEEKSMHLTSTGNRQRSMQTSTSQKV